MNLVAVAALLLSVALDAPFVSAEATALQIDGDTMWVEARVDTDRTAQVVLVRAVGPDNQPLEPVAMEADGSIWSTRLSLPRRSDIRLVFEHLDAEGFSFVSRPTALIELGVDPALFTLDLPSADGSVVDRGEAASAEPRWGWLAVGLGATALALVVLALGWRRSSVDPDD